MSDAAKPTDHRILSDPRKLMHGGHPADDRIILDNHMACQHGVIGHDDAIANFAIVRDMAIGHDQAMVANRTTESSLQEELIVTNSRISQFLPITTKVFSPLNFRSWVFVPMLCGGPNHGPCAYCRIAIDIGMGFDSDIILKVTVPLITA